ncbi:MAG: hypothetical protein HYT31_03590 [Parcubacteria group bacterium]|nr:hypothetical protein [Parcubacteria group bacterium]
MQHKPYLGLIMALALALASPALAQDEATTEEAAVDAAVQEAAAEEAVDAVIEEVGLSPEALEDEVVTEQDLEAETPGRFHFLTKIKRTVQRTITRDPIKKAEYRIEEAHEELLRAKKLVEENPDDEGAQERAQEALGDFERNIEKVKDQAADIKEKKADQAGAFLEKIADFQIKQQKMLDNLEEKLPEQAFAKVQEARQRSIANQSQVMAQVAENQQQIAERFSAAFEKQRGSEFRDFKNIEMMEQMSEFIPDEMKTAIEQAKTEARARFETQIQSLSGDARNQGFKRYVENISGDPVSQMRALDNIKSQADLPDEFFASMEAAKEKTINKFEERFRRFADPANREAFLNEFSNGSPENLRAMQQIQENVPPEIKQEIERKETQSIQRFKERFVDDPDAQSRAGKFQELAKKMRENPDPATFAAIQQIEQNLPPEQRAFVEGLKQEAQAGFQEQFRQDQGTFLKRIQSFDPNAIQQLQQFGGDAPAEFQGIISQAVNGQIDFTRQRLQQFDDPARFERFKQQIDQNAGIRQQIEARYADFGSQLQNKGQEIEGIKQQIEQGFSQRIEQERQMRTEQGLPDFSQEELTNIKERFFLRPQLGIEQGVADQFRQVQEQQVQREFQNQFREQAVQQGLQGDQLNNFLKQQGISEDEQRSFEQGPPQGGQQFREFQNVPSDIQQKLQEQFQNREQDLKQQIQRQGAVPQEILQRVQQQQQFQQFREQNQGQNNREQGGQPNEARTENSGRAIENQRQESGRSLEQLREDLKQNSPSGTKINEQPFEDAKRAVERQAEFLKQQQENQRESQKQEQQFQPPSQNSFQPPRTEQQQQPQSFTQPQEFKQPENSGPSFNSGPSSGGSGSFSPPPSGGNFSSGGGGGNTPPPPPPSGGGSSSGPGPSSGGGTPPPPPPQ